MEEYRQRYPNIYDLELCKLICSPQLLLAPACIRDQNSIANGVLFNDLLGSVPTTNSFVETVGRSSDLISVRSSATVSPFGNTRIWKTINIELARWNRWKSSFDTMQRCNRSHVWCIRRRPNLNLKRCRSRCDVAPQWTSQKLALSCAAHKLLTRSCVRHVGYVLYQLRHLYGSGTPRNRCAKSETCSISRNFQRCAEDEWQPCL